MKLFPFGAKDVFDAAKKPHYPHFLFVLNDWELFEKYFS